MSVPVVIIIGGPRPRAAEEFTSTMAENAVESPQFDIPCQDEELSFTEQAALLRAAADQLDGQQADASTEG